MSYCRFGEDSDVYVFEHVDGGWMCCGCWLDGRSTTTKTRGGMLAHLRKHRLAGHQVPKDAVSRLREERWLRWRR